MMMHARKRRHDGKTFQMKISREQVRRNRESLVELAAELVRERGLQGLSIGELSEAAGFTHGGFYNHFDSKEALLTEALARAFERMEAERERASTLDAFVEGYLSESARAAPAQSCPAAALASEVARSAAPIRAVFAEGLERMIASVEARLPPSEASRAEAIALLCRMVGAMMLARAVPDAGRAGTEILEAARAACVTDLAAAGSRRAPRRPRARPL